MEVTRKPISSSGSTPSAVERTTQAARPLQGQEVASVAAAAPPSAVRPSLDSHGAEAFVARTESPFEEVARQFERLGEQPAVRLEVPRITEAGARTLSRLLDSIVPGRALGAGPATAANTDAASPFQPTGDAKADAARLIQQHKGGLGLDEKGLAQSLASLALADPAGSKALIEQTFEQLKSRPGWLGGDNKEQVAGHLARALGDADLAKLGQTPEGREVLGKIRSTLKRHGTTEQEAEQIRRLEAAGAVIPASEAKEAALLQAAKQSGDKKYEKAVKKLIESEAYQKLDDDTKIAVLSQAQNYPNARSVGNFGRLLEQDYFQQMSLDDRQRALKLVGGLSSNTAGDQVIIDNTLECFLGSPPKCSMAFDIFTDRRDVNAKAKAMLNPPRIVFNETFLSAGNGNLSPGELLTAENTMPHEANHIVNGGAPVGGFAHFMYEYRGYLVGFMARYGHAMNRQSLAVGLSKTMLRDPNIRAALVGPDAGRIVQFVNQALGSAYTAQDLLNPNLVLQAHPGIAGSPVPDPQPRGNMDNRP